MEAFLAHVPAGSQLAFVVVQHLDPTYKGMLVELLQRATPLPVIQIKDRMRVRPGQVYVIPPNKDLSILHGVLHLLDPVAPRGLRLPIDLFFRALAADQQVRSIGVILSGMGSDGTLGVRAIKEQAGLVLVQEPSSAKFDGMPRSAIDAGLADIIAPAEELPGKLSAYLQRTPLLAKAELASDHKTQTALEKVIILLRAQTGHDFSLYKKTTIQRRIERRMGLHQIDRIATYVRFLQENPQEVELLFRELLIGVTRFFRDPAAWEALQRLALPALLTERGSRPILRAWVPGCATGEEAYTLAILFKETLEAQTPMGSGRAVPLATLQIFATDLDSAAIARAREGIFPANIAADVSAERLDRYFVKVERGYQVAKPIREMVIFATQNVIMDPPFTKLDFLSCRNLLIYLTADLQKKLLPLFHYSLTPGGFLLLGSAETIGTLGDLFATVDGPARLYRRLEPGSMSVSIEFPAASREVPASLLPQPMKPAAGLQTLTDQLLLQTYAPAAVLTSAQGDILYINGRTGKYLEPAAGKANWNIFAMARPGLAHRLRGAFVEARREKTTVTLADVVVGTNGGTQTVAVTVQPLAQPEVLREMVLVVFTDVAAAPATPASRPKRSGDRNQRLAQLELELD
ncbi:MAG: hypothetical protein KA764_22860, partial [Anaerolineales bacterium]|nr:hypothetical protein [Anaerolineales bacterium]